MSGPVQLGVALAVAALAVAALAAAGGWISGRRSLRSDLNRASAAAHVAEAALADQQRDSRENRQVQDVILDSMDDGVVLFDGGGRRAFANAAAADLLGRLPPDAGSLLPSEFGRAVARASYVGAVVEAEAETGTPPRVLRASATPAGEDGAVLLVVHDVTEAIRLDAVRRDFVTNASHELKTPAAAIQAAAETIRDAAKDDPAAVPRFAEQLERESMRLSRIIADLLDLSRLESGSQGDELVHLDALAREECARCEDQTKAAGVTLSVRTGEVRPVRGSPRDLALLVRNLVDNAIRYTKRGGVIDVKVDTADGDVVLTVRDTGIGIATREMPRVFERFYRVDRARSRETGGTGLGLAIVKHVAENLGGTVAVRSELGRGSTFEVRLPPAEPN